MDLTENMQGSEFKRKFMIAKTNNDYEMSKTDSLIATAFITGLIVGWLLGLITLAMIL